MSIAKQMEDFCGLRIQTDRRLSEFSSWKIGGEADLFAEIQDKEGLRRVVKFLEMNGIPFCFVGRGTNVLFDDLGYRGCVLTLGSGMAQFEVVDNQIFVGAACWVPCVVRKAARLGFSGIEHAIGIPASFGGLLYMNGGSQRKGISEHVVSVEVMTSSGELKTLPNQDCGFEYRKSRFQESGELILGGLLQFDEMSSYSDMRKEMVSILRGRRLKFPRKMPNCGSVFKSNPALYEEYGPPGKIIETLGFKGVKVGGVQVSPLHANFFVNLGKGCSNDVLTLTTRIFTSVRETTGLEMVPEYKYLHPEKGMIDVMELMAGV